MSFTWILLKVRDLTTTKYSPFENEYSLIFLKNVFERQNEE